MNNKNLWRRIAHMEDLLTDEQSPDKMSPAIQEAVDRLLKRLGNAEKVSEDSKGGKDIE